LALLHDIREEATARFDIEEEDEDEDEYENIVNDVKE